MVLIESSPVTVAPRRALVTQDVHRSVVWLQGEHDVATMENLCEILARTIALDDADVVVDLSKVTFMGAETVGVLVRARQFLGNRSRGMHLRSPSPQAMRTIDVCDLTWFLTPPTSVMSAGRTAKPALATLQVVPALPRSVRGAHRRATTHRHPGSHRRTHIAL
jgi:anti-anti-sigma factor